MINVTLLRQAITEGTSEYLDLHKDPQFTMGLFTRHGETGRSRAVKVQSLLAAFSQNSEQLSIADNELRILALADALFIPGGGPKLRECILKKLNENRAIKDHHVDLMFSDVLSEDNYTSGFAMAIAEKIQEEIKRRTGSSDPILFRSKRCTCLNTTSVLLNVDMFNVYSKVANNENAHLISRVTSTSCSVM